MNDLELLGVLTSDDTSRLERLTAILEREARQTAKVLLGGENREEAVSQAVDKAVDWLRSNAPHTKTHPWAYVKKLTRNSVIDYFRTNKAKIIPADRIKKDLAWIDEGMGYFTIDDKGTKDADPLEESGWHGIKIKPSILGKDIPKLTEFDYPKHPMLRALRYENLGKCGGWFLPHGEWAYGHLRGLRISRETINRLLKNEQDTRWVWYKITMDLIDNILSPREQEIMRYYLWGNKIKNMVKEWNIDKGYIKRVISRWLGGWGWDKTQRDKVRVILLTQYLANISVSIRDKDKLYNKVINAPQTRAYFFDLEKTDSDGLLQVCSLCHQYWYETTRV